MSQPVIGYAGMTHLGLCSAIAAAAKGFDVECFDADGERVGAIAAGRYPVVEPDLAELAAQHRDKLHFTAKPGDLARCDVVYVAPDVPTDDCGGSDLSGLEALFDTVSGHMSPDAVLVILSQVPPGFTRPRVRPDRMLYYQVETLIFGRGMERALEPERFIIGCADPASALPDAYATFLARFGCPVLPMRFESAELAKISINLCLVGSISVANTLAEICEGVGADWSEIVPALRLDRRIGEYAYLSPGLGIAGGNLERDLATIVRFGEELGADAGVVSAQLRNSRYRRDWVLRTLASEVFAQRPDAVLGILGLAYKQDTASVKNSPSLALVAALGPRELHAYDPAVPADSVSGVVPAKTPLDACRGADAVCIMTPWREFAELDPKALARAMAGRVLIDPYGVLDPAACAAAELEHFRLGAPTTAALAATRREDAGT